MSAKEELELDVSVMCLRCTVDARNKSSERDICSSEFRFKGGGWKLRYRYEPNSTCQYNLLLWKCSGVCPNPLHVSVQVESAEKDRIVWVLPVDRRFTNEFEDVTTRSFYIWQKSERDIVRSLPEFHLYGVLKFLVVLKLEGSESRASQTEWSDPEVAGQSSGAISTSVPTTLLPNAMPCLESLSQDLAQLMVEDSQHDVEFRCGGQSTKAHKLIVCKRSPVLASMLASDMVEGRTGVVTIPDMRPDIFAQFLRYVYSGQLGDLTFEVALRLYEAGDQYSVNGLAKRCCEHLVEQLSVDNAYEVLVVADAHSNKDFVEKVVNYMVENRLPLVSGEWPAFSAEYPKLANKVLKRGWDVFLK